MCRWFSRRCQTYCFHLEPGGMHLRSAVDIVLALFCSPKLPSLAPLFGRKFWRWGCFGGGRHNSCSCVKDR
jgi:hypothetical protein